MKDKLLPIIIASTILASCSSVYRSGQTPDDVYYSPTREVVREERRERVERNTTTADDQYLRMRVRNRQRWNTIDDFAYWNDVRFNHCNWNCHNTMAFGWGGHPYWGVSNGMFWSPVRFNSWNNPYYPILVYSNPRYVRGNTTASNIRAYGTRSWNNANTPTNPKTGSNNQGSLLKRVFTESGSTIDRSQRSFPSGSATGTSSSAGGRSGGFGSSGSSAGGSRGGRGN